MSSKVVSARIPLVLEKKLKQIMYENNIEDISKTFQLLISNYEGEKLEKIRKQKIDGGLMLSKYKYKIYNLTTNEIEKEGNFKDIYFDKENFINRIFGSLRVSHQYCFLNKSILYKEIVSKIFNTENIIDNQGKGKLKKGLPDFELEKCYVEFKINNDKIDKEQIEFSINSNKPYKIIWLFKD